MLDRGKNPFFEHAEADYFLAERNGETVGRIAAIANRAHTDAHHDRVGFFGFFESIEDQQVADALLDAGATWLRARGFDTMRGPASFSTNDESGLLIDGFDTPGSPTRPMQGPTGPGHTRDVSVTFDSPGDYSLVVQRTTGGAETTAPIRVKQ